MRFQLVLNVKRAEALGLSIPESSSRWLTRWSS